jgi:chromosome segregation ATPase
VREIIESYNSKCKELPGKVRSLKNELEDVSAKIELNIEEYNQIERDIWDNENQREKVIREIKRCEFEISNLGQWPFLNEKKEELEAALEQLQTKFGFSCPAPLVWASDLRFL